MQIRNCRAYSKPASDVTCARWASKQLVDTAAYAAASGWWTSWPPSWNDNLRWKIRLRQSNPKSCQMSSWYDWNDGNFGLFEEVTRTWRRTTTMWVVTDMWSFADPIRTHIIIIYVHSSMSRHINRCNKPNEFDDLFHVTFTEDEDDKEFLHNKQNEQHISHWHDTTYEWNGYQRVKNVDCKVSERVSRVLRSIQHVIVLDWIQVY